ncbi:MAG: YbaB/EbfC family nucleoid-associated protein [Xanthomonadales bacterium]|nr:YbaB/EbfC family nucleoid-associated protein [Xanthomonadales bacterium]
MKGNIAGLMQQAQKMQEQMQKAQEALAELRVTGSAGGGMVEVVMDGRHGVRKVTIDPSVSDDIEMLEDLVQAAINDAVNRVAEETRERMAGMTAGISLPPGMKLPF